MGSEFETIGNFVNQKERRAFPRIECEEETVHVLFGLLSDEASLVDLSLSGAQLEISGSLTVGPGSPVRIIANQEQSLLARVCWIEGNRLGVKFEDSIAKILNSWVGSILAHREVIFQQVLPKTA